MESTDPCRQSTDPTTHSSTAMSTSHAAAQDLFDVPSEFLNDTLQTDPFPIYRISSDQYASLYQQYITTPLPNASQLFPWLHGVDGHSYQQNLYFGVRRCLPPRYRGLMVVHSQQQQEDHEVDMDGAIGDENDSGIFQVRRSRLLRDAISVKELVDSSTDTFYDYKDSTVNLRNFQIQALRFASISDLVVYGRDALETAKSLAKAQLHLRKERMADIEKVKKNAGKRAIKDANDLIYRVLVIQDPVEDIAQKYPYLFSHPLRFWEQEQNEIRAMSAASEITDHIWVGHTQDAPSDDGDLDDMDGSSSTNFSICIEAHDLADMPSPSTLTLARETLNEEYPPSVGTIFLDVYSTFMPSSVASFDKFYDKLIHLLRFMDDQAARERDILIHCSDGYSETSLLVLSWIMYKQKLRLPEAFLYLQEKRSFFVYAADMLTLKRIDSYLQSGAATRVILTSDAARNNGVDDEEYDDDDDDEDEDMETPRAGNRTLFDDTYLNEVSNNNNNNNNSDKSMTMLDTENVYGTNIMENPLMPVIDPQSKSRFDWFYSPRFEGSFPSRILPFLYLGNLNHATNPGMLKVLGITHIVSVGEHAGLDASEFKVHFLDNLYDDGIDSIESRLEEAVKFIDEARLQNSHCMIHCRVGVSRSAAITICYIMQHLKYTLAQAYLLVRARRLNVIIQPNLKFMYEMLQLEQRMFGHKSIAWPVLCREIHLLNMAYHDNDEFS